MSFAFDRRAHLDRAIAVLRAGVVARDLCRRGGRAEVAAVFDRSFYLRMGEEFICIGEAAIGNGPTTLILAAGVAQLGVRQGQRAFVTARSIMIGDVLFDLADCETWRAPRWPAVPSPAALAAVCAEIAARAAAESPADSLARAAFGTDDTAFARLARRRVAAFAAAIKQSQASSSSAKADDPVNVDLSHLRGRRLLDAPLSRGMTSQRQVTSEEVLANAVSQLIGLGPGLTPAGDDFLTGALAALEALEQTDAHATLARAVLAASSRTSPLSASLLRAAAAGHVGENFHTMVAAVIGGDAEAAITTAKRIGHTSGWDALTGAVVIASVVATQSWPTWSAA